MKFFTNMFRRNINGTSVVDMGTEHSDGHSRALAPFTFTDVRNLDRSNVIMCLVATLLVFGIIMIFSTSSISGGDGAGPINITFLKHVVWIIFAVTGMLIMMNIDYHYLQKYSIVILIITVVGLIAVLVPGIGSHINGARRWIRFGSHFGFQPSEFAKLAMIIIMSSYIVRYQEKMGNFIKGFAVPLAIMASVSLLILKEPDCGTALFILSISFILIIVGGARIIYAIFAGMACTPFVYHAINNIRPYQKDRLLAFLDPWKYSDGIGYQITQSLVALGSGGTTGLGFGEGRQKLYFLPESSNDFIFSIIGEELGFVGATGIVIMFALFTIVGIKICKTAPDAFGFFLSLGITLLISLQSVINIAVATGSVPTTGLPLPFISSGGSSMVVSLLAVGILLNISKQSKDCNVSENTVSRDGQGYREDPPPAGNNDIGTGRLMVRTSNNVT